jgi:hypothetical protein
MFSRKSLKESWCAGLLAAAICFPAVATDRVVPSAKYSTLSKAYNAAVNGDRILIVGDISAAGFYISKQVTIQGDYESSGIYRKISLTSITPLTIDANTIQFLYLTIAGYNTSGTCVRVNAGKSGFFMGATTIQGPGNYALRDWGSNNCSSYQCNLTNTTYGIYGDNISSLVPTYLYCYNSSEAVRNARTNRSTADIGISFWAATLYAGPTNNARCLHIINSDSNRHGHYWFEVGGLEAFGYNSRCILNEGYNDIGGAYSLIYCPYD